LLHRQKNNVDLAWPHTECSWREHPGRAAEYASRWKGRKAGERALRYIFPSPPDRKTVVSLLRQLGWTQFLRLIPMQDRRKRDFYAKMCRVENWPKQELERKLHQAVRLERSRSAMAKG
jgi:hypothetical protein